MKTMVANMMEISMMTTGDEGDDDDDDHGDKDDLKSRETEAADNVPTPNGNLLSDGMVWVCACACARVCVHACHIVSA